MDNHFTLILFSLVIVALVGAWIWAVANLITTPHLSLNQKLIWGIVLLFLQTFGLLLYLAISPNQKDKNRLQNAARS